MGDTEKSGGKFPKAAQRERLRQMQMDAAEASNKAAEKQAAKVAGGSPGPSGKSSKKKSD